MLLEFLIYDWLLDARSKIKNADVFCSAQSKKWESNFIKTWHGESKEIEIRRHRIINNTDCLPIGNYVVVGWTACDE